MAEQEENTHMGQVWDKFTPYPLKQRGSQDVPNRFLQNAHWREDQGSVGYYARSGLVRRHLTPVEFNQDRLCWVELYYSNRDGVWTAFHIAEPDLGLQIPFSVLTPEEHLHLLGGDAASEDRSPRIRGDEPSSSQTEENDETTDMESEPEEICVQQPIGEEELRLIQRAESLHLHDEPRIAATQVEEVRVNLQIDPHTGSVIDPTPKCHSRLLSHWPRPT